MSQAHCNIIVKIIQQFFEDYKIQSIDGFVAVCIAVKYGRLNGYFTGNGYCIDIPTPTLIKLAQFHDVSVDYILELTDNPKTNK